MTQFTQNQQAAISHAGHDVLVSASAGSGKTTVLVERIVQQVLAGADLSRMLIVTFTNAATASMRERIQRALKERLTKLRDTLPGDTRRHLAQQIAASVGAPIMTLDAFSLQVVRQYYDVIGMDPGFRLLTDNTEAAMLADRVWGDLREVLYTGDHREAFLRLTANFAKQPADDGLTTVVMALNRFAMTMPDPAAWLASLPAAYDPAHFDAYFAQQIWPTVQANLQGAAQQLQALSVAAAGADPATAKVAENLAQTQAAVQGAAELTEPTYAAAQAAVAAITWPRWPGVKKGSDDAVKETVAAWKTQRDAIKEQVSQDVATQFVLTPGDLTRALTAVAPMMQDLVAVTTEFMTALAAEKAARQLQGFADIAQNALRILTAIDPQTGAPVGDNFKAAYDTVMVDEYQDINQLQEALLDAVSAPAPGNRFMVGDVKQSIYGFRLADPQLFLAKYARFAEPSEPGERLVLAENFRSTEPILAFTNLVFAQLMDPVVGQLAYDEAAELKYGATKLPTATAAATEVLIAVQPELDDEAADDSEDGLDKAQRETQLVIRRIQALVADPKAVIVDKDTGKYRRIHYRDITLLTRARTQNITIQSEFSKAGVPIVVADAQNYFKTTELMMMLSLLRLIDNPRQDIALAAVLRSPIVGLSADQLALVRLAAPEADYYTAVTTFAAGGSETALAKRTRQQVQAFLTQLADFREYARGHELVDLIWQIYAVTGLLDFVGGIPGGTQRQANLRALASRAASYEAGGFRGLFAFIHFIELMQKQDQDLALPVTLDPDTDAVSLMTIHGSKGLEFPVVFLLKADKHFNLQDLTAPLILSRTGAGITWLEPETRMQYQLPQYLQAQAIKRDALLAEEMRLLYVALTRAQQRLIIVGATADEEKLTAGWQAAAAGDQLVLPARARRHAGSYLDWIGLALARLPEFAAGPALPDLQRFGAKVTLQFDHGAATDATPVSVAPAAAPSAQPDFPLQAWLDWQYEEDVATRTTGFQAVTEIKRAFDDPAVTELQNAERTVATQPAELSVPQFLTADTVAPTSVGTATHLVLQRLPLTAPVTTTSVQATIDDLVASQVLTAPVAAKIVVPHIVRFFASDLGQLLLAHPEAVQRELPFSLLKPACQVFEHIGDGYDLLIHGIVDGLVTLPERVVLFDYKTDRVTDDGTSLIDKYQGQLNLYSRALAHVLGRPVTEKYLVALATGAILPVPVAKQQDE